MIESGSCEASCKCARTHTEPPAGELLRSGATQARPGRRAASIKHVSRYPRYPRAILSVVLMKHAPGSVLEPRSLLMKSPLSLKCFPAGAPCLHGQERHALMKHASQILRLSTSSPETSPQRRSSCSSWHSQDSFAGMPLQAKCRAQHHLVVRLPSEQYLPGGQLVCGSSCGALGASNLVASGYRWALPTRLRSGTPHVNAHVIRNSEHDLWSSVVAGLEVPAPECREHYTLTLSTA